MTLFLQPRELLYIGTLSFTGSGWLCFPLPRTCLRVYHIWFYSTLPDFPTYPTNSTFIHTNVIEIIKFTFLEFIIVSFQYIHLPLPSLDSFWVWGILSNLTKTCKMLKSGNGRNGTAIIEGEQWKHNSHYWRKRTAFVEINFFRRYVWQCYFSKLSVNIIERKQAPNNFYERSVLLIQTNGTWIVIKAE